MTSDLPKSTIRMEDTLKKKLFYIADFEGRSFNMQVRQILKNYVASFERKHGKIVIDE